MRIAFIVFNGMTLLDFIGFYDPVTRLKTMGFMTDLTWDVCAITSTVKDIAGLQIIPSKVKPNLSEYDIVFVPGGLATRELMNNDEFIEWIKRVESRMPQPDVVIYLDLPVEISQKLKEVRGNNKGAKEKDIHERSIQHLKDARECYLETAKREGWIIID